MEKEGEQALWCEGRHELWVHAHCVDVSEELYQALQESHMSWACPTCIHEALKAYHSLPEFQQVVHELQDTAAALRSEVTQLKGEYVPVLPLNRCHSSCYTMAEMLPK